MMGKHRFPVKPLEDVVEFYNGKSIKPGGEGQYPVYGSNGIIGGSDEYRYKDGIIIGRVGAYCGSIAYCEGRFWASDNTIVAKPKDGRHEVRFLYYLLSDARLNRHAGGAAQPLVTQTVLRQVELPVPPLPTQRKIAAVLSAYDDLIENNTRRIRILEQMAQALYREWFVHFRFPGHEKVKLVDSPLGKIPEGWEGKKLGEVIELAYGKGLKEENRCGGPVPVFGSGGVVGYHNESYVRGPGIVVGRKGNVGSVFWSDADFWPIDTTFFVVTELSLPYVFYDLLHQAFVNNDAAVPGLSRNAAYLKTLLVPDDNTLTAFESFVLPMFSQLRVLREKNANLRRTRDLLLPRLISGEVEVAEVDIAV